MPAFNVTVTATFVVSADQTAVETAKGLIEAGSYTVAQATANTDATVKTWLATQINTLVSATGINTVTAAHITITGFTAASAGTSGNTAGVNGSFNFTVPLTKGSSNITTASKPGTITATAYAPPTYAVNIGWFTGGSVTASPAGPEAAGTLITLTIIPDAGYELTSLTVNSADVTTSVSSDSYSFTMPANNVTIDATFAKTQATLDAEDVAEVQYLIESSSFDVTQAAANTEAALKAWLVAQINALSGMPSGITVTATDITISNFLAATAGVYGNPSGTDGRFTFTVNLTKGASSAITTPVTGAITATPDYTGTEIVPVVTLTVASVDGGLLVRGLVVGDQLSVYNIRGQLLYKVKATDTEQRIYLRERGVYVVVSGKYNVKAVY
jgi:hypothetical protein